MGLGLPTSFLDHRHSTLGRVPVAARFKAWVYDRSLAGVAGSNPTGGMNVSLL